MASDPLLLLATFIARGAGLLAEATSGKRDADQALRELVDYGLEMAMGTLDEADAAVAPLGENDG